MPITPYRARVRTLSPPWLRDGTGERLMYALATMVDARMEMLVQSTNAHMPRNSPSIRQHIAPSDALAQIGTGMAIQRGLTESDESYATRLQRALDSWRFAGTARGLLSQILGYLLSATPMVRFVWTQYVYPPANPLSAVSSSWFTYPEGRDPNVEPIETYTETNIGFWNWDGRSPITGSWGWWSGYLILYSVGSEAWCNPAGPWGDGTTYTPAPDGYYSEVSGRDYALAGSYAGTPTLAWGEGSTYIPGPTSYYSDVGETFTGTLASPAYVLAGRYNGASQGWGVDVTENVGKSIQIIAKQFKAAETWIRAIIVSFDNNLFSPNALEGGGVNPDGYWGQWSKVSNRTYAASRLPDAVYGGTVL